MQHTPSTRKRFRKGMKVPFTSKERRYIGNVTRKRIDRDKETKTIDIQLDQAAISTLGSISALTSPAQGTGNMQRIGLSVEPTFLQWYWEWIKDDTTNIVRMSVIEWFENDATPPVLDDIYQDTANVLPLSDFNFDNVDSRFKVHYDTIIALNSQTVTSKVGQLKFFGSKLPKRMTFDNGAITGEHKIYLVLWSDSDAGGPFHKLHGAFHYTDA